jgi:hypothetical protein
LKVYYGQKTTGNKNITSKKSEKSEKGAYGKIIA